MYNLCKKDKHIAHIFYHSHSVDRQPVPLFSFFSHDTIVFGIIIHNEQCDEVDLSTSDISFRCKRSSNDQDYLVCYSTSNGSIKFINKEKGYIEVTVTPDDTVTLGVGDHPFDVTRIENNIETHLFRDYLSIK